MDIFGQLQQWIEARTMLEIHYINAGKKHMSHGRVLNFDPNSQLLLFYSDDAKNTANISLTQIEDMIPFPPLPAAVPAVAAVAVSAAAETAAASPTALALAPTAEEAALERSADPTSKPGAVKKKNLTVKEEIIEHIESLPTADLYPLLPIIKHLAKIREKEKKLY